MLLSKSNKRDDETLMHLHQSFVIGLAEFSGRRGKTAAWIREQDEFQRWRTSPSCTYDFMLQAGRLSYLVPEKTVLRGSS